MATYRNLTDADNLPDTLTRQWYAEGHASHNEHSTFGVYAVCVNEDGAGMIIPLYNKKAADRARDLAAMPGWTVQELPDSRLMEASVAEGNASRPRITVGQKEAFRAVSCGQATAEQQAIVDALLA